MIFRGDVIMSNNMKIGIFNGTIATTNGLYRISDITVDDAKKLVLENGFISAIGHEATAKCISDTFNINIPMNRIDFKQEVGQKACQEVSCFFWLLNLLSSRSLVSWVLVSTKPASIATVFSKF